MSDDIKNAAEDLCRAADDLAKSLHTKANHGRCNAREIRLVNAAATWRKALESTSTTHPAEPEVMR